MEGRGLGTFLDEVSDGSFLRVESDLGNGFVRLRVSEAQRRQAKQDIRCVEDAVIEMLRNARDAHARNIFLATARSADLRTVTMVDDGDGVPQDMRERIFEPRVTSKLDAFSEDDWGVHGRGMALYSIKENAAEASVTASVLGEGSAIRAAFRTCELSERKDQSTLPELSGSAREGWRLGTGPRNIARATAEFALSCRSTCTVYFGSPVEVAATLRAYGRRWAAGLTEAQVSADRVAPAKRIALCCDAAALSQCACELGLDVSQRSAYRILQGEVEPLAPLLGILRERSSRDDACSGAGRDGARDMRGLKIASEDIDDFSAALKLAWRDLAEAYYLESDIDPVVKVSRDGVQVTFPAFKQL